ncbi:MAG: bifunctional aminoglycoside phosphotransferase/ATP-binding protein [Dehalococcoidia bacterium]
MSTPELPELIGGLLEPAAYPHAVGKVELVQTHISYVLLAGDFVYKIKKPVDFGFLDFTTLAKRRYYCRQEVILNRRLCPDAYLGVVRITGQGGRPRLEGRGKAIEWAVKMRRLPADCMMDSLLAAGKLSPAMVEAVAERLADFHARAATSPAIGRYGARAIRIAWEENFDQWEPFIGDTITAEQDRYLRAYVRSFFLRQRPLLERRVQQGRIRDCHGDVRSESVCFVDGICIFDCIEFNRRFRYTDVAGDIGFLAMDLDFRDRPDLASILVQRYAQAAADPEVMAVIGFYKCYRACVRGKVESFKLAQAEISAEEKEQARAAARRYFRLACQYAAEQPPPALLITCGLVATGKTVLARALGEAADMPVFSSDVVRKELAGLRPTERRFEPFGKGIYSPRFSERTYKALLERARAALAEGRSVIIDATFAQRARRQQAKELAQAMGARFFCLECRAAEEVIRQRLDERLRSGRDASDARWETYEAEKRVFEPVSELPPEEHLVLDCDWPLAECVEYARRELERRLAPFSA